MPLLPNRATSIYCRVSWRIPNWLNAGEEKGVSKKSEYFGMHIQARFLFALFFHLGIPNVLSVVKTFKYM